MSKLEEVKEILLNVRQYLCNTEFAPLPFTRPVDAEVFPSGFATDICSLFDEPLIRAEYDKEKAEFGLSVHEAAIAMTLKEVGEWLNKSYRSPSELDELVVALFKGEMPK